MENNEMYKLFMQLDQHSEDSRESYCRAPFGWPGAKSKSVEYIVPHLPYRNGYGEPFGGSGAVLLSRRPSHLEVFNDKFSGVCAFYRVIRDRLKMNQLLDRLALCLHSREEFIWCRDTWKNCEDDVERAARWWYMVTVSFGAQGRNFGRAVRGKVQQGPKLKTNLKYFTPCHLRLLNVQIENQDWREILRDFDCKEFVWYLDPPYYRTSKGMYECEMPDSDHIELLETVMKLQGFVAISGYDNPLYSSYKWTKKLQWKNLVTQQSQAKTQTNNLLDVDMTRGNAVETLWIKDLY
jgi:DNA adenine methylase